MLYSLGIIGIVIVIDQIVKYLVVANLDLGQSVSVIDQFFYITLLYNDGAAWGILGGSQIFFLIVTIIAVIVLGYYLYKERRASYLIRTGLALFIAGALGNFIDRIINGEVTDYLNFYIPVINYDFPVFNIADMSLVIGFIIILIFTFVGNKDEESL